MSTLAPSATNNRAAAAPWPRAAPVMIAVLPWREPIAVTRFVGTWGKGRAGSDEGGTADPAGSEVGLPPGQDVQVVAVGDERAVAPVDRRAPAGENRHGARVGHRRLRDRAGTRLPRDQVGEHQDGVGHLPGALPLLVGDLGQPRAEVEEAAEEDQAESEQAAGDDVRQ